MHVVHDIQPVVHPFLPVDTLALATGTRVGASDHAMGIILYFVWSCPWVFVRYIYIILWFNCAHNYMFVFVVIMWRTL